MLVGHLARAARFEAGRSAMPPCTCPRRQELKDHLHCALVFPAAGDRCANWPRWVSSAGTDAATRPCRSFARRIRDDVNLPPELAGLKAEGEAATGTVGGDGGKPCVILALRCGGLFLDRAGVICTAMMHRSAMSPAVMTQACSGPSADRQITGPFSRIQTKITAADQETFDPAGKPCAAPQHARIFWPC